MACDHKWERIVSDFGSAGDHRELKCFKCGALHPDGPTPTLNLKALREAAEKSSGAVGRKRRWA